MPIGEWLKRGYVPAYGRKLSAEEQKDGASLLLPEGTYGPAFERITGYCAGEAVGRNGRFIVRDDLNQLGLSELRMALGIVITAVIGFLTYDLFVRATFIGRVLNGQRYPRALASLFAHEETPALKAG